MGSRFVCTPEASSHQAFKEAVVQAQEGDTALALKQLTPVRLLKNSFYKQVAEAESSCATIDQLQELLGRARAKLGMYEGDMTEGELEIGQVSSIIKAITPAADVVAEVWNEFVQTAQNPFAY
jgi:enoyl-[acyl-carrier protein] reductase II